MKNDRIKKLKTLELDGCVYETVKLDDLVYVIEETEHESDPNKCFISMYIPSVRNNKHVKRQFVASAAFEMVNNGNPEAYVSMPFAHDTDRTKPMLDFAESLAYACGAKKLVVVPDGSFAAPDKFYLSLGFQKTADGNFEKRDLSLIQFDDNVDELYEQATRSSQNSFPEPQRS